MGRPPTSPRLRPTSSLPLFQIGPNQINLNPNHADQQPIIALFSGQDELGEGKRVLDHFDETVTKPHSFLMLNVQCQLCLSKILGLLPGLARLDVQLESLFLCHYNVQDLNLNWAAYVAKYGFAGVIFGLKIFGRRMCAFIHLMVTIGI